MKELSTTIEFVCTQRGPGGYMYYRKGGGPGRGGRDMFNKVRDGLALRYHGRGGGLKPILLCEMAVFYIP